MVTDDEVSRFVRTIGGVRTPESLTIRNAAIAGDIGVSPSSPSLSQALLTHFPVPAASRSLTGFAP